MTAFFLLLCSTAVSMLVVPMACRLAPLIGMVDAPDPRKVHTAPVPRVGGWGIAAGALAPLVFLGQMDPLLLSFIDGVLVLFAFGSWDDARQIGHWPKFAGQLAAACMVVFWGDLYVTRMPFMEGDALPPLAGQVFTVVAIVGVINAINHSDGLDGLAAGETLLSLVAVGFLGYLTGAQLVTDLALVMIGGIIGFLRYNTHPARVFMGDSGSQVLGFAIAFLVVYLVQEAHQAASAALPLLLLGLPIADINVVLWKRMRAGLNWFKATRNHVHHRLLDLGFSHYQSVVVIYSFQAGLVTAAVLLRYASDLAVVAAYFGAILSLFGLLVMAEKSGWRLSRASRARWLSHSAWLRRMRGSVRVQSAFAWVIAVSVSCLMLVAALRSGTVPRDFGILAAAATLAALLVIASRREWRSLALHLTVYVTVAFATYLLTTYPGDAGAGLVAGFGGAIVALAVVLGVFVRFLSDERFGTTPTDYLIAFALLALLAFGVLGNRGLASAGLLRFVTFSVVLFYACEVVIGYLQRWRSVLGSASLVALLVVAVRGLSTGI